MPFSIEFSVNQTSVDIVVAQIKADMKTAARAAVGKALDINLKKNREQIANYNGEHGSDEKAAEWNWTVGRDNNFTRNYKIANDETSGIGASNSKLLQKIDAGGSTWNTSNKSEGRYEMAWHADGAATGPDGGAPTTWDSGGSKNSIFGRTMAARNFFDRAFDKTKEEAADAMIEAILEVFNGG